MKAASQAGLLILLLASASQARADRSSNDEVLEGATELNEAAATLAQKLKAFSTKEERGSEVVVGSFVAASPNLKASSGPGIRLAIERALRDKQLNVVDRASLQLKGEFTARVEQSVPTFTLLATVLDGDDRTIQRFSIDVQGSEALQLAGATVDVPSPDMPAKILRDRFADAFKNPQAVVKGTQTQAAIGSPFAVEIGTVQGSRFELLRPSLKQDGRAYVGLKKGDRYYIKLSNQAPFEAAASVSIDGLNLFAFSREKSASVIIPAGKTAQIEGWFIAPGDTRALEVSGAEDSEAARLGAMTDIGTITVAFAAAWDRKTGPPPDEGRTKGDLGTKLGQQIGQTFVAVQRSIGRPRAIVSVRY